MKNILLTPPCGQVDYSGMIDFCSQLIQLSSYTGHEQAVAQKMKQEMEKLGFDQVWIDSAGNVIGEIRGSHEGPKILFDGHIDTVEVSDGDKWTVAPFGGVIKNDCIFGRGASDMKGALASMVYGLAPLIEKRHLLHGSLFISGTVCEETFEGVALAEVVKAIQPDFVVIGEASNLQLKRGQRGRAEIAVTTYGKAAHSSNPTVGKNAVYMMMQLVQALQALPMPQDEFLGSGILELTDMVSSPYPGASVVPHFCRATYDRRTLVGETEETVLAPLRASIEQMTQQDRQFRAGVAVVEAEQPCYTGIVLQGKRFFPAWELEKSHPLVSGAVAGLQAAGLNPELTKYNFCTNGSYSAGMAHIPTIGFGPGKEDGAHVVDEHIEIEQLKGAAVGYQAIAAQFLL